MMGWRMKAKARQFITAFKTQQYFVWNAIRIKMKHNKTMSDGRATV